MLTDKELQIARVKSEFTVSEAACYWMDEDPQGVVGDDVLARGGHIMRLIGNGCQTSTGRRIGGERIVTRRELIRLAGELNEELPRFLASSKVDKKEPPIQALPDSLDPSTSKRLNVMIEAANYFWGGVEEGTETLPLNKTVAAWIEDKLTDKAAISTSLAESMASIIRPDWAKYRTWKETKKR